MKSKWFWLICVLLSAYFCLFSVQKINFLTADIGRHIKNGEIFLHSDEFGISKQELLHTNLFSYTNPKFPFINHHWGSGVLAYLIFSLAGFSGLSLVYVILLLLALIFSLKISKETIENDSPLPIVFLVSFFLVPLIADRMEVRPEAVSYFFISLFIFILYQFSKDRLSYKFLFILPFVELFWSNLHIYFIFGLFIVGIFLFESLLRLNLEKFKKLGMILGLSAIATLLTPYGFAGAIYPFTIFQNYGYLVVENQSITFLEKLSFTNPSFLWYKITLFFVLISSLLVLWKKRDKFPIALSIISLTFAVLAFLGIRHMTVFALVSLPLLVYNFSVIWTLVREKIPRDAVIICYSVVIFFILISTLSHFSSRLAWNRNWGLGLLPHSFDSSLFIKENNIEGPVFNNYDIGGNIIYNFFPQKSSSISKQIKVFVDNRPEAYPKDFLQNTYIPMQENSAIWKKVDNQYNFNIIYFYRLDMTPWSQNFLLTRIDDPEWAPVYVDAQTIIFLKRNDKNKKMILQYELPRSMFTQK